MKHFRNSTEIKNSKAGISKFYKFHPSDVVPHDIGIEYMNEKIPLEIVPFLLKNLKQIEFQVMSSSFLNLNKMNLGIKVLDNIKRDNKVNKYLLAKYDKIFNEL